MTGTREAPVEVGEGVLREEDGGAGAERVQMGEIPSSAADRAGAKLAMEESQDGLFVSEGSEDGDVRMEKSGRAGAEEGSEGEEDKKKLALDTTYDGFSIYGRILCLVVKRRGTAKGKELAGGSGQAMMEEWIASTQMGEAQMMDE